MADSLPHAMGWAGRGSGWCLSETVWLACDQQEDDDDVRVLADGADPMTTHHHAAATTTTTAVARRHHRSSDKQQQQHPDPKWTLRVSEGELDELLSGRKQIRPALLKHQHDKLYDVRRAGDLLLRYEHHGYDKSITDAAAYSPLLARPWLEWSETCRPTACSADSTYLVTAC